MPNPSITRGQGTARLRDLVLGEGPRTGPGAIALSLSILRFLYRMRGYPLNYLFVPDAEIWQAQALSWAGLIGEFLGLFLALRFLFEGFVRLRVKTNAAAGPGPFPGATIKAMGFLESRGSPWALGSITSIAMLFVWGGFNAPPYVHDEAAYRLQAELMASGHWAEPALPLPRFFDQMYVFTTPFHSGKYPPGFPLALVPGYWIHIPLLVPLVLAGISGGLLFTLARRIANPWVAALAWLLFTTAPRVQSSPPPYMSQWLTQALWLLGWWGLLRWKDRGRLRDLLILSISVGWCAITRPLTAAAFALPAAIVVLWHGIRARRFLQIAAAGAAGLLVLALLPLWNFEVTGSPRTSPLVLNVKATTPYDQLGLGRRVPAPTHDLPQDLKRETRIIGQFSTHHDWSDVPIILGRRLNLFFLDWLAGWRVVLLPLVIVGMLMAPPPLVFAFVVCALDVLLYLLFPHPPQFTMYYMEIQAVVAVLVALGMFEILRLVISPEAGLSPPGTIPSSLASAAFVLLALMIGPAFTDLQWYSDREQANQSLKRHFREVMDLGVRKPAIVFVRYSPDHSPFQSLIENGANFPHQSVWIAYDRGAENPELLAIAPERHAYLFDEQSNSLKPYVAPSPSGAGTIKAE